MMDPLEARSDDAPLSIHALSEFVFCPRAGLCTYENYEESEEQNQGPSMGFMPIHTEEELRLHLQKLSRQFWSILLGGLVTMLLVGWMALISGQIFLWGAMAGVAAFTGYFLLDRALHILRAWGYLEILKNASPLMPDPNSAKIQEVNWCRLLAAGFELSPPQGSYHFVPWKFGGKPWMLLEHGNLCIPVFLPRRTWNDLRPQHFVRIAAYCRLIALCQGSNSPYGVIAMPDSYKAIIVPCTIQTQEDFYRALYNTREIIRNYEERNVYPNCPWQGNPCSGCPHGEPIPVKKGKEFLRNNSPLRIKKFHDKNNRWYHSHCGDRFDWMPPHYLTKALLER